MRVIVLLTFWLLFMWELLAKWPDEFLHLTACDVGQGDAILLSYAYTQMLIDTGPDDQLLNCLNKQLPFWDKKIDVLILTHFDADHIGGFRQLSQNYTVGYIFLPLNDYAKNDLFLELKEILVSMQEAGTIIKQPFLGQQIALSKFKSDYQAKYNSIINNVNSLSVSFIAPFELSLAEYSFLEKHGVFIWQKPEHNLSVEDLTEMGVNESNNNLSIAFLVEFGQLKLLFLGDLESTREVALMDHGLITEVDIQKVGHHGSKTSSSLDFLLKTRPELALISSGQNNSFGHPNSAVLANFELVAAKIWRTDQLGMIEILSDGQNFWLKYKKH